MNLGDLKQLARLEQEARAAGALNHPNVLTVHDLGYHEGAPFLVSELLEGESLEELLEDRPLPWRQAVTLAAQAADGLAAAHDKGIVHRDLKPGNLFVTRDERIRWRPAELRALKDHKVGAFFLGGKNRTRCQLIQQLVRNWPRMKELAGKTNPPFAFRIPPQGVKVTRYF